MLPITDYTDTDKVRAVIGVTDNEVNDAMLVDMMLSDRLLSELDTWLPTHAAVRAAGIATGASASEVTAERNLRLYATYFSASHVDFFQLAMPNSIGDGKNIMKRFEGMDFEALAAKLRSAADTYKDLLVDTTIGAPTLFGIATPDYDPVTNT